MFGWTALLPLVLTISPSLAPEEETLVQRDIEFARGLATRFGFLDLAVDVLATIDRRSLPRDVVVDIELARGSVRFDCARHRGRGPEVLRMYEGGLAILDVLLDTKLDRVDRPRVEQAYMAACVEYIWHDEWIFSPPNAEDPNSPRTRRVLRRGLEIATANDYFPPQSKFLPEER